MFYEESVLLTDCVGHAQLKLNENKSGTGIYFGGIFQEAGRVNKNKRKYTFEALDKNVKTLAEAIKGSRLVGELDHATDSIIHLSNTSHLITKLWWEGQVLMGEAKILPTASGRQLKGIIESGVSVGISSRGVGNGEQDADGVLVIEAPNFRLLTFDVVADPSTHGAYQKIVTQKESFEPQLVSTQEKIEYYPKPRFNAEALCGLAGILAESHVRKIRNRK